MTSPEGPRRRRQDGRPQKPALIAPTPSPQGEVPEEVSRSIDLALERARTGRRHVTLVAVAMPAESDEATFAVLTAAVRDAIREGDGTWRDGARSLVALLADLDGPGALPALQRLERVLDGYAARGAQMGRASAPPGIGARDLLDLARVDRRPLGDVSP